MKIFWLISLLSVATCLTDKEQWLQFKIKYGKNYSSFTKEESMFNTFQENLRKIENHNARYEKGEETYYLKVTKFADLSPEEFRNIIGPVIPNDASNSPVEHIEDLQIPDSVDWRAQDVLNPVKESQGDQCAAGWAFAATAAMESYYALAHLILLSLSEQNLIDCSQPYGNNGCTSGNTNISYVYVSYHGIMLNIAYPYEGTVNTCRFNALNRSPVQVVGTGFVNPGEDPLSVRVGYWGPAAVSINADSLQLYGGGIFNYPSCSTDLNHFVLAAGYGYTSDLTTKYWIVRNSWGRDWGEDGYFRLIRDGSQQCGFASAPSTFPFIVG